MQAEPVYLAYEAIVEKVEAPVWFISPRRDRCLISRWQETWRKRKTWFSFPVMKGELLGVMEEKL